MSVLKTIGLLNIMEAFYLVRRLYCLVDWLIDKVIGYSLMDGWRVEREEALAHFERSAHCQRVVGRFTIDPGTRGTPANYILLHDSYLDPRAILGMDRVTLHGLTTSYAWFSVIEEGTDIYDMDRYPFCFVPQFFRTQQVVRVDLATFRRLAYEEVHYPPGGDGRDLVLIDNTARCGSTLVCQMFAQFPETRVMSEPFVLMHCYNNFNCGAIDRKTFEDQVATVTRLLFCPQLNTLRQNNNSTKAAKTVVLKMSVMLSPIVRLIKTTLPQMKVIFITRHIRPSLESFEKMMRSLPIYDHNLPLAEFLIENAALPYDVPNCTKVREKYQALARRKVIAAGIINCLTYSGAIYNFLRNRSIYQHSMIYEDLASRPDREIRRLLANFGMPADLHSAAAKAMAQDSQRNFFDTKGIKGTFYTEADWMLCDQVLQELGLPFSTTVSVDELRALIVGNDGCP